MVSEFGCFFCFLGVIFGVFRGMLVVFVYSVSLAADPYPEAWGIGGWWGMG